MSRMKPAILIALAFLCGLTRTSSAQNDDDDEPKSAVHLTIVGTLEIGDDRATITAKGKDELLDISFNLSFEKTSPLFAIRARSLNGRTAEIRGALVLRPKKEGEPDDDIREEDQAGHENYLLVPTRAPRKSSGQHYVQARVDGVADTDRVAIGSETTGIEIEIAPQGERRWQLDMSDDDKATLYAADKHAIEVHGRITLRRGKAIPYHWRLKVSELVVKDDKPE